MYIYIKRLVGNEIAGLVSNNSARLHQGNVEKMLWIPTTINHRLKHVCTRVTTYSHCMKHWLAKCRIAQNQQLHRLKRSEKAKKADIMAAYTQTNMHYTHH